ncbi:MAG: MAPEG family protein [Sphingomicrobium sp.]
MTADQKIVAIGAASGVITMLLSLWLLFAILPDPEQTDLAGRIGYALRWNAVAVLPLIAMIGAIGNARALSEAIDPTLGKEDRKMLINSRVAGNTLEQFVLFLVGSLALAASIEGALVKIVGAAAITFVVMRIAFWIGYRLKPLYRAFGFASTFYMNLGLIVAALWLSAK